MRILTATDLHRYLTNDNPEDYILAKMLVLLELGFPKSNVHQLMAQRMAGYLDEIRINRILDMMYENRARELPSDKKFMVRTIKSLLDMVIGARECGIYPSYDQCVQMITIIDSLK